MMKKVVMILIIGFVSLSIYANENDTQRNNITHSAAFWKLYTDALRGEKTAQFETGVMFERGMGVEMNQTQAAKWYEKAAIQEHKDAQYNIGIMYATGRGVEHNEKFAMMWLACAAKQGDNESRTLLLEIIDGKSNNNNKLSSHDTDSIQNIKPVRFATNEGASICVTANESKCTKITGKYTYTSKSKRGNYYKISGVISDHKWKDYIGDGYVEMSAVEIK